MHDKAIRAALLAPRRPLEELSPDLEPEERERAGGIEGELKALIDKHGPNPERIVALLAGRAPWERRRAAARLAGDYGRETADVLIRSAENHAIYDTKHPAILRLRDAAGRGAKGHRRLLAAAVKKRAAGRPAKLPEDLRGRARPLPDAIRAGLERTVGESASDVRVLVGGEAGEAARGVGALAVTTDRTILIGDEHYAPGTEAGAALLTHEAVHALQQRNGDGAGLSSAAAEHEADRIAGHAIAPAGFGARAPVQVGAGRQSVARKTPGDPSVSASASAKVTFTLGAATVDVDLEAKAAAGPGGATASASAAASVKLDTSKLNPLLPDGIEFTDKQIAIQVKDGKLVQAVTINAKYAGKEPYLKPGKVTFTCSKDGKLSAKLSVDLEIPGFAKATSDKLEVKKEGISGDIKIEKTAFQVKGVTIEGGLTARLKNNTLDAIDGDAKIALPDKLGDADIACKVNGGHLESITAAVKSKPIPGLGALNCTLKWSEKGGFELPPPGQKVDVSGIPGLGGSVKVSFALDGEKSKFSLDTKDLKFTSRALEKVKLDKVELSETGLKASIKLAGVELGGPSWVKISNLKGTIELDGAALTCKNVSADVAVTDLAKGSVKLSLVDGNFKAAITLKTLAVKVLDIGKGLELDVDLGNDGADVEIKGDITVNLGSLGSEKFKGLGFKGGHFTGKCTVPFQGGLLKGISASVELLDKAPWVKAEIDGKGMVGKKLDLPKVGDIAIDATITEGDLKLAADLSSVEGHVKGKVEVDHGKIATGDFALEAKGGHIEGDLTCKVKKLPLLKGSDGEIKIKVKDGKVVSASGNVSFEFEQFIEGKVTVGYDLAKGFFVEGKKLTLKIPGLPFDVKPFDAAYKDGQFSITNVVATLKPKAIPGVAAATLKVDFVGGKLTLELTGVKFSIPELKQTTLSAKWSDGKWDVKGEAAVDLPKGIKLTAKFDANNAGKDGGLQFNCDIKVDVNDLKQLIPGVDKIGGSITLKYHDGKLTLEGGELAVSIANGVLGGDIKFSMDETHAFNAKGKFKLALKFIKAKEIDVVIVKNELQKVEVKGLELDLIKGKAALTGSASYDKGGFGADLKADVKDLPWVEKASAHVVVKDNHLTAFSAEGTFKKTPGIDLSGVTIGGKLENGEPSFFAKGKIPIKGLPEPLEFDFEVGPGKLRVHLKGAFTIPGLGVAKIDVDVNDDQHFRLDLTVEVKKKKGGLVSAASAFVEYTKGKGITFGGSVTLNIGDEFEATVGFKKLEDNDFEFEGSITPATKGEEDLEKRKKPLFGPKNFESPSVEAHYGVPFLADVHVGAGIKAGLEAGVYKPAFKLLSGTISGKLSALEKGELPDAHFFGMVSGGAYASAEGGLRAYVGGSLAGFSLDLEGSAVLRLEAKAMANLGAELQKKGSSFFIDLDLSAELSAALKLILAIDVMIKFASKTLKDWNLGTWPIDLANFNAGKLDIGKFHYEFGKPFDEQKPSQGQPKIPFDPVLSKAKEGGVAKAQEAKDRAVEWVESNPVYKVGKAVVDAAKSAWHFITSW